MSSSLTICLVADREAVDSCLDDWSSLGLLENVVCCAIDGLCDLGTGVEARHYSGTVAESKPLSSILHERAPQLVTVTALRPDGLTEYESTELQRYLERERKAVTTIAESLRTTEDFRRGITLRAITVGTFNPNTSASAFPHGSWDLHLVHDSQLVILPSSVVHVGERDENAALCALIAICAGGGWRFSDGSYLKIPPRAAQSRICIVRPQMRLVFSGDFAEQLAASTADVFPGKPPWPRPSKVECVQEVELAVPGKCVDDLARSCGFDLRPLPPEDHAVVALWARLRDGVAIIRGSIGVGEPGTPLEDDEQHVVTAVDGAIEQFDAAQVNGVESAVRELSAVQMPYATELSERRLPNLGLGMTVSSDYWPKFRRLFYSLVDACEVPPGVNEDDLMRHLSQQDRWALDVKTDSPWLRVVYAMPTMLAPPPNAQPFQCDDELRQILGVSTIDAGDVLQWYRADRLLGGDRDPYLFAADTKSSSVDRVDVDRVDRWLAESEKELVRHLPVGVGSAYPSTRKRTDSHGTREPSGESERSSRRSSRSAAMRAHSGDDMRAEQSRRWSQWNSKWRENPLSQLAGILATALFSAYDELGRHMHRVSSDAQRADAVRSRRVLRPTFMLCVPVLCLVPILLLVVALVGSIAADSNTWLLLIPIIVWASALGFLGAVCARVVKTTLAFEAAEMKRWHHSRRVVHYSHELTRLNSLARAFADHQMVVRTMLYDPFASTDESPPQHEQLQLPKLLPASMILATADVDEERLREILLAKRAEITGRGWMQAAHERVESQWRSDFRVLVGPARFDSPDADYTSAGTPRYRDIADRELSGSREHFRGAVSENAVLRTAARVRRAKEIAGLAEDDAGVGLLGSVRVKGFRVMESTADNSADDFLTLDAPDEVESFDPELLAAGVSAQSCRVDEHRSVGTEKVIHTAPAPYGTIFCSWRMLVSDVLTRDHLRTKLDRPSSVTSSRGDGEQPGEQVL